MNPELIERYIDGELEEQELKNFEKLLAANSDVMRDYKLSLDINHSIIEDDVMQLRETLNYMYDSEYKVKRLSNTFTRRKLFYAAASIALIMATGGLVKNMSFNHVNTADLFEKYYQPYEVSVTYRSGNTEVDKVFLKALQKYEEQDFEQAMLLFEQLLELKDKDMAVNLYSGISYMEEEKYQNASRSFSKIIDDKDNLFVEQAKWYLALCYVVTNEAENAKVLLKDLVKDDSYYKKDARKLLREIK